MNTNQQQTKDQDLRLKQRLEKIKNKIVVLSGKGGVGKSTVSVSLSHFLAASGFMTGIMDTDIHGPNIAKMLGIENRKLMGGPQGIEPYAISEKLKAVSMAFFTEHPDAPIIWRGPLKMATIKQFISDVNWGELDYLVIDSPPGTGDEPLSVCQMIPDLMGAVIVTTPQDVAILDARKSVLFARELNIPIIGIIENMEDTRCPHCGEKIQIFGSGGGRKAAEELKVPFLGTIPFDPLITEYGDSGKAFITEQQESETGKVFNQVISKITQFSG